MRAETKYKSVAVAVLTATLLVGLYLLRYYMLDADPAYMAERKLVSYSHRSLLGPLLLWLQSSLPVVNGVLYAMIMALGALIINKFTIQNNLYGVATKLPCVIYVIMGVTYLATPLILKPALAALMVAIAIPLLHQASTSRRHASPLFRACLALGVLPLLYAELTLLMPLWIGVMLVVNSLSYRDIWVALAALVSPLLLGVCVEWQLDGSVSVFGEFAEFFAATIAPSVYAVEWISLPALFVVLCGVVSPLGLRHINDMSMRYSLRRVVMCSNIWLMLSLALLATPAFSFELIGVVAAPAALLFTIALLFIRRSWMSYMLYVALIVPFVAGLVLALLG